MAKKVKRSSSCKSWPARRILRRRLGLPWVSMASISWRSAKTTMRTANQAGTVIPVEITIYTDQSFTFVTNAARRMTSSSRPPVCPKGLRQAEGRKGRQPGAQAGA